MKSYLLLPFTLCLFEVSAHAACHDSWSAMKKCGKNIDGDRRRIERAGIDILTLGKTRQDREVAKANKDKEVAAERRRAAERAKASSIRQAELTLASLGTEKEMILVALAYSASIEQSNKTSADFVRLLFDSIRNDRSKVRQLNILLRSQRENLNQYVIRLENSATGDTKSRVANLRRVLSSYEEQLTSMPGATASDVQLETWFDNLAQSLIDITLSSKEFAADTRAHLERVNQSISQQQTNLLLLKGKTNETAK